MGLWEVVAIGAGVFVFLGVVGFHIIFDMFGAPHPRRKYWFEFWRSK